VTTKVGITQDTHSCRGRHTKASTSSRAHMGKASYGVRIWPPLPYQHCLGHIFNSPVLYRLIGNNSKLLHNNNSEVSQSIWSTTTAMLQQLKRLRSLLASLRVAVIHQYSNAEIRLSHCCDPACLGCSLACWRRSFSSRGCSQRGANFQVHLQSST
jgi:hypothetical protein